MEAKWLFGVELDQIEVVVHPQSVIHSAVSSMRTAQSSRSSERRICACRSSMRSTIRSADRCPESVWISFHWDSSRLSARIRRHSRGLRSALRGDAAGRKYSDCLECRQMSARWLCFWNGKSAIRRSRRSSPPAWSARHLSGQPAPG